MSTYSNFLMAERKRQIDAYNQYGGLLTNEEKRKAYRLSPTQYSDYKAGVIDEYGNPTNKASSTSTSGSAPLGYTPAYGGIPQVPSLAGTQSQAVQTNLTNLPALLDLSSQINAANLAEQTKQYTTVNPQYLPTLSQFGQNIYAGSQGQISDPTNRLLRTAAANYGISVGMPGDQPGRTATNLDYLQKVKDFTEQRQANALNQQLQLNAATPTTALFNPATMAVTPEQQYNAALQQSVWNAAPNPAAAAAAELAAVKAGSNLGYRGAYAPVSGNMPMMPSSGANVANTILSKYGQTAGYLPQNTTAQQQPTQTTNSWYVGPQAPTQYFSPVVQSQYGITNTAPPISAIPNYGINKDYYNTVPQNVAPTVSGIPDYEDIFGGLYFNE